MLFVEAKKTLCSAKLNIDYDDVANGNNSLFSLQDIEDAINYGVRRAWDYKIWPFTETNEKITGAGSTPSGIFTINKPDDLKALSAFLVVTTSGPWDGVGNGKRNFKDFMKWIADYPSDKSKIWTEFNDQYLFNANCGDFAALIFNMTMYAKLVAPAYTSLSDDDAIFGDSSLMPFSYESEELGDSSGNDAIILYAFAWLLDSEKKKNPTQAEIEEKNATAILDVAWAAYAEGKAQNLPQNRPFFNVPDFFPGRPNRGNTTTGNFP
jgi:hypothetical protein